MITNCLFGSAFEQKNSGKILKSFLKHQNSRKKPKKLKVFFKELKADPKKLKEKLQKLKNPPTQVEMSWHNLAKKKACLKVSVSVQKFLNPRSKSQY